MADNIKITTGRNGRKLAYRWSPRAMRWFRMPLDEAELAIATGSAMRVNNEGKESAP